MSRPPKLFTYDGFTGSLAEWGERTGIPRQTIKSRIDGGWELAEAFTEPSGNRRKRKPEPSRPVAESVAEHMRLLAEEREARLSAERKARLNAEQMRRLDEERKARLDANPHVQRALAYAEGVRAAQREKVRACLVPIATAHLTPNPTPGMSAKRRGPLGSKIKAFGQALTISEWAQRTGINISTLKRRLKKGEPPETAFSRPAGPQGPKRKQTGGGVETSECGLGPAGEVARNIQPMQDI